MTRILERFTGDGVGARARRSAVWSFAEFGGQQGLRLASNLVLTRLLFPEAFGLMALVTVVTAGLSLFSDTGVRGSIIQNARGDDPDFLDTAWTVQVIRGALLWLMTLALARPVAALYDEPMLAQILPVAGLALLIRGFEPTSIHSVNRHLALGRLTRITLGAQAIALVVMALLAWQLQSVWALVIGSVIAAALKVAAHHLFLPGRRNRIRLERDAFWQIFHFGKWVFLSTAAGFLITQGDRAILGLYISLETLGIYNIGFFLASVPMALSRALQQKVVFPLYRMKPPAESAANRAALFRARRLIAAGMLALAVALAFAGPALVGFLYDPRYEMAGAMITLYALSLVPIITLGPVVVQALMGLGDSRRAFFVNALTALLQTGFLVLGVELAGLFGAILAPGLAMLASYPLRLAYARRYRVWDPVQDLGLLLPALAVCTAACLLHREAIAALLPG